MSTPNENSYEYSKNGLNCKVVLSLDSSEKIIIKVNENDNIYESKYNLENIKRKSKFFQICNISEIYSTISNIFENKKYELEKKDKSFLLKIQIEFYDSKNEAIFELIDTKKDKDDLIQQLLIEQKEIKDQLNSIQDEMKEKFNLIMLKLNQLTNKTEEEDYNFENIFKKSKIIKIKGNHINCLKNWINPNNNNIKVHLLYDAKRDGGLSTVFHQLCDNKGPTLTIIKTSNGKRIGGFTSRDWNKNTNAYISDNKSFLFDLDQSQRYNVVSADKAIWSGADYGPIFGANHDLVIYQNCFVEQKGGYYYKPNNSYYDYSNCSDNNKNQVFFKVEEMEVYQIIF